MDLLRRRPVNHNEALDPAENQIKTERTQSAAVSKATTLAQAENELKLARLVVDSLEMLIAHLRGEANSR
jgi:hypothetical protein